MVLKIPKIDHNSHILGKFIVSGGSEQWICYNKNIWNFWSWKLKCNTLIVSFHKICLTRTIFLANDDNESKQASKISISENEKEWRRNAKDFKMRLCGHCNTITDIKEANFFGRLVKEELFTFFSSGYHWIVWEKIMTLSLINILHLFLLGKIDIFFKQENLLVCTLVKFYIFRNGQFIVAGSDDGSFFIWDRSTTNIVHVLKGDQRIVNCLQPHPSTCLLATSGIDPVIRLWSPLPEDGTANIWKVENSNEAATANYIRMNTDHFEVMLFNMGYRLPLQNSDNLQDDDDRADSSNAQPLNCRPS